jgi:3-deoxy-manno-octulosonate cytidylyltransferase (CMP-KDO synthetase)
MAKVMGVIPARLESHRLPRKVLRNILGRPMIEWVYQRTRRASSLDGLVVATDSEEVFACCHDRRMAVEMTSSGHRSGTDRIVEVMHRHRESGQVAEIYVNVQGDEPMVSAEHINLLLEPFHAAASVTQVSTLKVPIGVEDARDPNNVKVVTDVENRALYFSRALIPHDRANLTSSPASYYKHLGLYAYAADALEKFHRLPPSHLEQIEKLEQLRLLENGIPIVVWEAAQDTIGVDAEEDLQKVEAYFRRIGVRSPDN